MEIPQAALFQLRFQKQVGWVQLHVNIYVIEKSKRWWCRDKKEYELLTNELCRMRFLYIFVSDIYIYIYYIQIYGDKGK